MDSIEGSVLSLRLKLAIPVRKFLMQKKQLFGHLLVMFR